MVVFRNLLILLTTLVCMTGCDTGPYGDLSASGSSDSGSGSTTQTATDSNADSPSNGTATATQAQSADEKLQMARLRELKVIFSKNTDKTHIATVSFVTLRDRAKFEEVLDIISSCQRIHSVDLNSSLATDDDLRTIAKIKTATTLILSGTDISDEGIKHIAGMGKLETLYLVDTNVTNDSLPVVAAGLKNLRILDLSNSQVDGGLAPLAMLPQLDWLLLSGATIKDNSLSSLPTRLKRLTLNGATIQNEDSLNRFKSKARSVTIDR